MGVSFAEGAHVTVDTLGQMAESEGQHLLKLWEVNICPNCGKSIPEGMRTGSGAKSEGGFCSLSCYGEYYKSELIERHKKRVAAWERGQMS